MTVNYAIFISSGSRAILVTELVLDSYFLHKHMNCFSKTASAMPVVDSNTEVLKL